MALKKKSKKQTSKPAKKKPAKVKRTASRRVASAAKLAKKKTKKKPSPKTKKKTAGKKRVTAKRVSADKTQTRPKIRRGGIPAFPREERGSHSGELSGDLQGLPRRENVDSESVDELLEEGNAFEAGVVAGVEEADDQDEREVHTREVPEDDVPSEYLDED